MWRALVDTADPGPARVVGFSGNVTLDDRGVAGVGLNLHVWLTGLLMSEVCRARRTSAGRGRTVTSLFHGFGVFSGPQAPQLDGGYRVGTIEKCQSNDAGPICSHL